MKTLLIFENIVLNEAKLPNGHYRISGSAIHPCKTFHPNEWAKVRQYVEPYLKRAAPTLVKACLVIDHSRPLPAANSLKFSRWNKEASSVDFEGEITEEVYRMFKSGVLKPHVSVGVDWMKPGGGIVVGEVGEVIPCMQYTETIAVMAKYNPFFERAGMTKVCVKESDPDVHRFITYMDAIGFNIQYMSSGAYITRWFTEHPDKEAQVRRFVSQVHKLALHKKLSPSKKILEHEYHRLVMSCPLHGLTELIRTIGIINQAKVYLVWRKPN
jgi:hypothetical protein